MNGKYELPVVNILFNSRLETQGLKLCRPDRRLLKLATLSPVLVPQSI